MVGRMTSSPSSTPTPSSARWRAAVPEFTATASPAPVNFENSCSNRFAFGPVVNHPDRSVSTTDSTSSSPMSGRAKGRKAGLTRLFVSSSTDPSSRLEFTIGFAAHRQFRRQWSVFVEIEAADDSIRKAVAESAFGALRSSVLTERQLVTVPAHPPFLPAWYTRDPRLIGNILRDEGTGGDERIAADRGTTNDGRIRPDRRAPLQQRPLVERVPVDLRARIRDVRQNA